MILFNLKYFFYLSSLINILSIIIAIHIFYFIKIELPFLWIKSLFIFQEN